MLLPISVCFGNRLDWQIIALPGFLLALQLLAFGMALALAHLRALFPDVEQILQAVMPLWMWTLPIIYPETVIPLSLRSWLWLNPPYALSAGNSTGDFGLATAGIERLDDHHAVAACDVRDRRQVQSKLTGRNERINLNDGLSIQAL